CSSDLISGTVGGRPRTLCSVRMRAVRRFTVRAGIPAPLAGLTELATNLRWTWHPPTRDLFASIDPVLAGQVGGDPLRILVEVEPRRLDALAEDQQFLQRVRAAADDLREYLTKPRWYQRNVEGNCPQGIAYFSMEFGVTEALPNYSGGLGVLAGDHLK